jgi:hypothetical protein
VLIYGSLGISPSKDELEDVAEHVMQALPASANESFYPDLIPSKVVRDLSQKNRRYLVGARSLKLIEERSEAIKAIGSYYKLFRFPKGIWQEMMSPALVRIAVAQNLRQLAIIERLKGEINQVTGFIAPKVHLEKAEARIR